MSRRTLLQWLSYLVSQSGNDVKYDFHVTPQYKYVVLDNQNLDFAVQTSA